MEFPKSTEEKPEGLASCSNEADDTPELAGTISFQGKEFSAQDFFGKGIHFSDNDVLDQLELSDLEKDEDEDEEEQEEIDFASKVELLKQSKYAWREVLETAPVESYDKLKEMMDISVTEDGLVKKRILEKGTGIQVFPDGKVWFDYVGFCGESKIPYDSTLSRRAKCCALEPPGEVIAGLRLGLKTMKLFESAQFVIDYSYGYGELGCPPRIPTRATIVLNVRVITCKKIEDLTVDEMSAGEKGALPFEKIYEIGKELRQRGNFEFSKANYRGAIRKYRQAIDVLDEHATNNKEQNETRCELLATLYSNMSKCYLLLKLYPQCCNSCKRGLALKIGRLHHKFLLVFAEAKFHLGDMDSANNLLRQVTSPDFQGKCQILKQKILDRKQRDQEQEKEMAKKMLGLNAK